MFGRSGIEYLEQHTHINGKRRIIRGQPLGIVAIPLINIAEHLVFQVKLMDGTRLTQFIFIIETQF